MSLTKWFARVFNWSAPQRPQGFNTFILEPILTPSGLVDSPGDDTPDLDLVGDSDIPDLDNSLPDDSDIGTGDSSDSFLTDEFDPVPFSTDEPLTPKFEKGVFTVGDSGKVGIDFLYDGGGYKGQLAIFSLEGMEDLDTEDFIAEAARRASSNSTNGYIVIDDASEGARFNGRTAWEGNFNSGEYKRVKTFDMNPGDTFGIMLVPNGTVEQVANNPNIGGSIRPLFSLETANPNDAFHVGQIADVTGDGNTFVMEDLRVDGWTDQDYNDIVFQVRGATGEAVDIDEVIDSNRDWRNTDWGQDLVQYVETTAIESEIEDVVVEDHPTGEDVVTEDNPSETTVEKPESAQETETSDQPFAESDIVKDEWEHSQAYSEGETTPDTDIPDTVDPNTVVNPWNVDRDTFLQESLDPNEDGFGAVASTTISVTAPAASPVSNIGTPTGTTITATSANIVSAPVPASSPAGSVPIPTPTYTNYAPTVTAYNTNVTMNAGNSIGASSLFRAYDANGDAIQSYWFYDNNNNSGSGYLTVNGVKQTGDFIVTANQLSGVRFVAGSQASTDGIFVQAYDGKAWGNSAKIDVTTYQPNRAPVVSTYNQTIYSGSSTLASSLFNVYDADGDAIQRYYFSDSNSSSSSGYFIVNGVKQTGGFYVTASQLNSVRFVGGSQASTDSILIYANDGKTWSNYAQSVVTTYKPNRAPVVSAYNRTVNSGTSMAASNFFSAYDPDGDAIQHYYFYDSNSSSTSGYFTVNGVKQTGGFSVTASQLGSVRFVGGSQAGTEGVYVYAHDGKTWSSYAKANLTTYKPNRAPVVSTYNRTVNSGTSIAASSFFSAYDPDGDTIQYYYFSDSNSSSTSGYFTVNGVKRTGSFSIAASQLGSVRFVGGSQAGTDSVYVYAHDGKTWSSYAQANLTTQQPNRAPVVTTYNQTVKRGQSVTPNFTVSDADGDTITRYAIYDGNSASSSGYFTIDGVKQQAGRVIYVDANQLSKLKFVGGSGTTTDRLYISASDGKTWSSWSSYTATTQGGSAPTVSINNASVNANTAMSLSLNASDPDGDKITRYEFSDNNAQSTSGYFTVNGVKQHAGQTFAVDADKLHTVKFVGGTTGGVDRIAVRATDGVDGWSAWNYADFTTKAVVQNDWFDLNIKDTTIRSLARSKFQDGSFSRQDMIDIFDSAKDGGVVDSNEFADLQLLSSDVSYIKMADYVRNLSTKIAHGDKANEKFLGQALGNLYAGSSATQLQKLMDEHFFGKDLPLAQGNYAYGSANQAAYKYAQGQLFQNGIQYTDVRQGALGDCYYLAALAGIALKDANKIKDMFIDNGDGTYTVRFFKNGKADYVTVNRELPTDASGIFSFAKAGDYWNTYNNTNNELWVALAEKAYAQVNEAGWIGQDGTNSYKGIEGGGAQVAAEHIAQVNGIYHSFSSSNVSAAISAFASGAAVFFSSDSNKHQAQIGSEKLVGGHAYLMTNYNSSNQTVTLFNPWNSGNSYDTDGYLTVSWNDVPNYFYAWRQAS
ncbi:MAG: C2 family cysteine protease [Jaaginema sp. PMC 1079.18]|nr:C2 family cysteine protease [Jaaginema sp. PMC 1080.18]MEC4849556.1 C2 family cysteine protease [Jaaginema sp. PMC 1079.18]MEC4867910.1 C2 family cysteine protease [Jaaginema sp. PMC 1078.18]